MELSSYHKDVLFAKVCPYCKSATKITTEKEVYGRTYKGRAIICCVNFTECDSYVGTHDDGSTLGRLANKELRIWKSKAHSSFDKIWKEKHEDRTRLYKDLADYLGLPDEYTHIGMFNIETCKKVEVWANELYKELSV